MPGVIGTKVGMTSVYDQDGRSIPVTVIQAGPCVVTQVRNIESDGYKAIQLAYGEKKEKNTTKSLRGHFKKARTTPKKHLVEFRDFRQEYDGVAEVGNEIRVGHIFKEGDWLDVIGISKGKGFQGVVKRHGFAGVGGQTHGQHNRLRAPGAIGNASSPSRVFKGKKMAGRTGNKRVKTLNLRVIKIIPDQNIILVKGAVPGAKKGTVILEK